MTQIGSGYTRGQLHAYADSQLMVLRGWGRDIYNTGEPTQFLTISNEEDEREETYVWHSHDAVHGAVYMRTT